MIKHTYEMLKGGGDLYLVYDDIAPKLNYYECIKEDEI